MLKRIIWVAVLAVVGFGLWVLVQPRPVTVDVAAVATGPIRSFVEEEGMTRVVDRYVVSMPVAGRLGRIDLHEGDTVAKGAKVAEIDPVPLRSRVEETEARIRAVRQRIEGAKRKRPKQEEIDRAVALEGAAEEALAVARSELQDAEAELTRAARVLERVRKLIESGSATQSELDAAQAAEDQARARVQARKVTLVIRTLQIRAAKLDTEVLRKRGGDFEWEEADYAEQIAALEAGLAPLRQDAERAVVRAPVGGVVLNRFEVSRRVLPAGTPILEIGDLARLEVEADFLSEDVAHMNDEMKAEVFGRALGGRVLPARIQRIHPSAFTKISSLGVEQQRVKVVVDLDAGATTLRDRYRVEVRIVMAERDDAVLVPEGALFRKGGAWHAFRVVGDTAELVEVETGLRNGLVREVKEGLAAGDRVVLHPDNALEEGTKVEAIEGDGES
jgi:HlyD family secretion protein